MLLSFFSYNPVILYIMLLVENANKYVQYIVSPAKQKRDICTAFPASLSSSSSSASSAA